MIKIDIIKKIVKKIFKHPAYLFIFLFFLDLIIGGVLSWKLILSPESDNTKPQSLLVLNKTTLDKFIQSFSVQEEDFQKIDTQKYPDIFAEFSQTSVSATSSATSTKNK